MSPLSTPPPCALTPQQRADHAVAQILQAQVQGEPAGVVLAPPGSGKTAILERVAAFEVGYRHGRAALATQTNVQSYDLARRLREGFPKLPVCLFIKKDLALPSWVDALPGLRIARASRDIPPGPGIVVANGARWSWMDRGQAQPFTLLAVDEAYQLADYRFAQIAGLAPRLLLVGDPGQIDPIVHADIARWACERAGPHVPCPDALFARHSGVWRLGLPVSRRLVSDTVRLIQPAFYRDLPFVSLCPPRGRALQVAVRARGGPLDRAIALACGGRSIVQLEAPAAITGEIDARLAQAMVDLLVRLFAWGTAVRDGRAVRPLTPEMVGVVCANVRQVAAIRERLPQACAAILVETANRFQGLERPVMLVHHPLSGRADADQFHLDAGRLCVALTRHRVACFVFARAGIEDQLRRYAPSGVRILDSAADPEFEGWSAHLALMQALHAQKRIIPLP